MKDKIDIDRCARAMADISIEGRPRSGAIADAIAAIQSDGIIALSDRYIGVKNYAHFGDQREDHYYGYGPAHGHIVFSIRRTDRSSKTVLGPDHVYLLECARDFGSVQCLGDGRPASVPDWGQEPKHYNICDVIRSQRSHSEAADRFSSMLSSAMVTSHEPRPA